MNVNTILWALSFEPVRIEYPREEVERDLTVALDSIKTASFRWPGVESALELYNTLIPAYMRIYDQKGDVDASVGSPADTASGYDSARSDTASPIAQAATPGARALPRRPPQAGPRRPRRGRRGRAFVPELRLPTGPPSSTSRPRRRRPSNGHAAQQQRRRQHRAAAVPRARPWRRRPCGVGRLPRPRHGAARSRRPAGAQRRRRRRGVRRQRRAADAPAERASSTSPPATSSPRDPAAAAEPRPAAAGGGGSALPEPWNSDAWTDYLHAPWAAPAQIARTNSRRRGPPPPPSPLGRRRERRAGAAPNSRAARGDDGTRWGTRAPP